MARLTGAGGLFPGALVAVFGAENEHAAAAPVLDSVPQERRLDLMGRVDLPTAYACLERCDFYIGNDSGLMHIAAASGIPTLGLFGPSREELYGPCGNLTALVRTPENFSNIHPDNFNHKATDSLMDSLSVDQVLEALSALIAKARGTQFEPVR